MVDDPQGTVYASFVSKQLEHEYDRRSSISTRAGAAVTTSTGLVTLVLAVIAVARGREFTPRGWELVPIIVAVVALLVSGALAVGAGVPQSFIVRDVPTLMEMLEEHWTDTEITARNTTARFEVQELTGLRKGNSKKQRMLTAGLAMQVVAIAALTVAVLVTAS